MSSVTHKSTTNINLGEDVINLWPPQPGHRFGLLGLCPTTLQESHRRALTPRRRALRAI